MEATQKPPFPPPVLCLAASQRITERFFRDPAKPADEDVEERAFLILEERIQLRYHCREDHITASRREFLRRTEVDSKGNKIIMTPEMCISYEVGPGPWPAGAAGWGGAGSRPRGPSQGGNSRFPAGEFISAPWENEELPSQGPPLGSSSETLTPTPRHPQKDNPAATTTP